jgi:FixJ family two-component response regulator
MITPNAKVLVVDDDSGFRTSIDRFLRSVGYAVETFDSPAKLLDRADRKPDDVPTCVLLDLRMPGMSGLETQNELMRRRDAPPIVFVTAHGDVPASVQAMKKGAVDFLEKPFDEQRVLEAIERALGKNVQDRSVRVAAQQARARLDRLTARERQVCDYLMAGLINKQIASELNIAESTVKVHRSRMMEKLGIGSVVALMRLRDQAAQA